MFIAVDDSDVLQAHDVRIWQKEASKAGNIGGYNESVKAGTGITLSDEEYKQT